MGVLEVKGCEESEGCKGCKGCEECEGLEGDAGAGFGLGLMVLLPDLSNGFSACLERLAMLPDLSLGGKFSGGQGGEGHKGPY